MKKILLLLILFTATSFAQFPANLDVNSNGAIAQSPSTKIGNTYRITVEGTYSMWPQFPDCHGVDAAYVYDVPQEEIDAYRWPPVVIKIGTVTIPFVEIPHWVGDDKIYAFPPKQIATPLFELSFRKYKGFRIDGEPLPNTGIDMVKHRYQIEKSGTGQPLVFQILDSNYSIAQEGVIPRFEDNCGSLRVTIETVEEEDINICDIKPICDKNHQYVGIKLLASIFGIDTANLKNRKNILGDIDYKQLGIVENGRFKCEIDSIVCGNSSTSSLAVGLIVDRSGSMSEPISEIDDNIKMDASKRAINRFIDSMKTVDSAFVISFSSDITLDQDWTSNKSLLKASINNLEPETKTAVYGAIIAGLDKMAQSSNPNRAIILLSDGANTYPPNWSKSILDKISSANIPIYIIALGLSNDIEDVEGRRIFDTIATASRGKVYDVYNAAKLDSIYLKLSKEIVSDDCCAIYFKLDSCVFGTERFIRIIYAPVDTVILSKVIKIKCDTCSTATSIRELDDDKLLYSGSADIDVAPNPINESAIIRYRVNEPGEAIIKILDMSGNIIKSDVVAVYESGTYIYKLNTESFSTGFYYATVWINGVATTKKVVVVK